MTKDEISSIYKHPSRFFNRNLIKPPNELIQIRNIIYQHLPIIENREYILDRYKKCIDVILMNLYICAYSGNFLRIPRSKSFRFLKPTCRENRNIVNIERCNEILDAMEKMKLIIQFKGFQRQEGFAHGMITRVVSTKKLINYFQPNWSFSRGTFENIPIVLRDKDKIGKAYRIGSMSTKDDEKIMINLRKIVIDLNKRYKRTVLSCEIPIAQLDQELHGKLIDLLSYALLVNQITILKDNILYPLLSKLKYYKIINQDSSIYTNSNNIYNNTISIYQSIARDNLYKILKLLKNPSATDVINFVIRSKLVYRIFNENYRSNGRFYGPVYQRMNNEFRKYIKIDDEDTIELDYNALHLRMLYNTKDIDFKGDPYIGPKGVGRKYMKRLALIAINTSNKTQCVRAIFTAFREMGVDPSFEECQRLLDFFCKSNKPISEYFFSSKWKQLCFADSLIMNNILVELMNQDIVGLPIHDSVIVKAKHEETLRQIMIDKYKEQFGFDPII